MDAVEHSINRLMRKLEGNAGDLEALETICTALRESINSTHNTGSQKCLCEVYNVWDVMGDIAINKDCPFHGQALRSIYE